MKMNLFGTRVGPSEVVAGHAGTRRSYICSASKAGFDSGGPENMGPTVQDGMRQHLQHLEQEHSNASEQHPTDEEKRIGAAYAPFVRTT